MRGQGLTLPSAQFFKRLKQMIVPGRRHLRVLIGDRRVAPGEYAADDPLIQGQAESLVTQARSVLDQCTMRADADGTI